jgi:hypothetical protein
MMGLFGTIINGCQAAGLEHKLWMTTDWQGKNSQFCPRYTGTSAHVASVGLLFAYTAGTFPC